MCPYDAQIDRIKQQIMQKYSPKDIFLFGSCACGIVSGHSDIDICIVIDTDNKRKLASDIQLEIESDIDVDIVVYTPNEWEKYKDEQSSFAHIIYKKGVSLIDRH